MHTCNVSVSFMVISFWMRSTVMKAYLFVHGSIDHALIMHHRGIRFIFSWIKPLSVNKRLDEFGLPFSLHAENPTAAATRWKNIGCKVKAQAKLEAVTKAVSKLVHKYQQLYKDRQKERQKLAIKQRQRSLSQAEVQIIPKPNLQLLNRRLSTADTTCTAKVCSTSTSCMFAEQYN